MDEIDFYLYDLETKFKKINFDKYFLSYSGGRDSHFLFWFIKKWLKDDKIKIVSINTYMEHPEIFKRMKENADIILRPQMKPFEIKEKYGSPCFSKLHDEFIYRYQKGNRSDNTLKYIYKRNNSMFGLSNKARELLLNGNLHKISNKCCQVLKQDVIKKYKKETKKTEIIAVRCDESILRKSKYKSCFNKKGVFTPLYDLTDDLLRKIEIKYNIEVPQIYNYISRTGCMGCPYGRNTEKELALVNNNQYNFLWKYFKESYEVLEIKKERQLNLSDELSNILSNGSW